jgi:hypothetical protein
MPRNQHPRVSRTAFVTRLLLTAVVLVACGRAAVPKTHTIGVVTYNPILAPVLDGFKTKMAALGYVEGQNVTYLHRGLLRPDREVVAHEVESLVQQRVDLLLTLGTEPTSGRQEGHRGHDDPGALRPDPRSRRDGSRGQPHSPGRQRDRRAQRRPHPEGAGVAAPGGAPGGNDLHDLSPQGRGRQTATRTLVAVASSMGIDLRLIEAHSPEEGKTAIAKLPSGAAIFFVSTPSLEPLGALVQTASPAASRPGPRITGPGRPRSW